MTCVSDLGTIMLETTIQANDADHVGQLQLLIGGAVAEHFCAAA